MRLRLTTSLGLIVATLLAPPAFSASLYGDEEFIAALKRGDVDVYRTTCTQAEVYADRLADQAVTITITRPDFIARANQIIAARFDKAPKGNAEERDAAKKQRAKDRDDLSETVAKMELLLAKAKQIGPIARERSGHCSRSGAEPAAGKPTQTGPVAVK